MLKISPNLNTVNNTNFLLHYPSLQGNLYPVKKKEGGSYFIAPTNFKEMQCSLLCPICRSFVWLCLCTFNGGGESTFAVAFIIKSPSKNSLYKSPLTLDNEWRCFILHSEKSERSLAYWISSHSFSCMRSHQCHPTLRSQLMLQV